MPNYNNIYMSLFPKVTALVLLILVSSLSMQTHAALGEPIGQVLVQKGVATARSDLRELTALAKESPIYLGDTLETAARSFLVVRFRDGGKITLRPESQFVIDDYEDTPGKEKESFKLLKGGLRAVTGAIGKNRPDQVSFEAKNTTIGIRGTTFVIKLCTPGMDGCTVDSEEKLTDEEGKKEVDIFIVDKDGGKKQKITKRQLRQILEGVYVSVEDGAVRFDLGQRFVDMVKGDNCVADAGDVECFSQGIDLPTTDPYLTVSVEDLSELNLFDDTEVNEKGEICEID